MNEIERLNYVNGRRLDAADFRLEQRYLVDMRRRLNQGLFTPGVVSGLEVRQVAGSETNVTVAPGMALDPRGFEIVLTEERTLTIPAQQPSNQLGYFLVISYAEERLTGEDPDCGPPLGEAARVREQPRLEWTEIMPSHRDCGSPLGSALDCGIVLALVSLSDKCEIALIDISLRELANPTHSSQATAYAMEGEKDIDVDNPKVLHFQVRGGSPSAVTLYLWADRFSSLHYTQMGEHEHVLEQASLPLTVDTYTFPEHAHGVGDHTHRPLGTNAAGRVETLSADLSHRHRVLMQLPGTDTSRTVVPYAAVATHRQDWWQVEYADMSGHTGGPPVNPRPYIETSLADPVKLEIALTLGGRVNPDGSPASAQTGGLASGVAARTHSHVLAGDVELSPTGSPDERAGSEPAYRYFTALKVELDDADITAEILRPLSSFGRVLGNGTDAHDLVRNGTDAIDLLDAARAVGKVIDAGSHTLRFSLAAQDEPHTGNGGKIIYNLFVE